MLETGMGTLKFRDSQTELTESVSSISDLDLVLVSHFVLGISDFDT
jgi:hypothetical protein